ncbi:hypothetical protein [uncultured Bacteroides sp.]|uniref:hypothetical protein n=1 Tax=uncultured Bacteroides sp. TaxID=162156 RepID=UPI002AAB8CDB|nr:hypothetical protein [uncultured Bacteroides sp.]
MEFGRPVSGTAYLYTSIITDMGRINTFAVISTCFLDPKTIAEDNVSFYTLLIISIICFFFILIPFFWISIRNFLENRPIYSKETNNDFFFGFILAIINIYTYRILQISLQASFLIGSILFVIISISSIFLRWQFVGVISCISIYILIKLMPKWWSENELHLAIIYIIYLIVALIPMSLNFRKLKNHIPLDKNTIESFQKISIILYFFELFTAILGSILNWTIISKAIERSKEMVEHANLDQES